MARRKQTIAQRLADDGEALRKEFAELGEEGERALEQIRRSIDGNPIRVSFRSIAAELQSVGNAVVEAVGTIQRAVNSFAETWKNSPIRKQLRELQSLLYRGHYEAQANPLYAWREYRNRRAEGEDIPDWVLAYFDRAAMELDRLRAASERGEPIGNAATAIAEALEMKQPGKGKQIRVFSQKPPPYWLECSFGVYEQRQLGCSEEKALLYVATAEGLNITTVRRAWQYSKSVLPGLDSTFTN